MDFGVTTCYELQLEAETYSPGDCLTKYWFVLGNDELLEAVDTRAQVFPRRRRSQCKVTTKLYVRFSRGKIRAKFLL